MRGGLDYDPNWGKRMTGTGPYANLIAQRFRLATRRLGLNAERRPMDLTQFVRPPREGEGAQLSLL
jgi:DNA repair photolyase